jgi:hypothetical protein
MINELIYLACPYSDSDITVKVHRFEAVNKAAAKLMNSGKYVFSPISHTHPIAVAGELPTGWEFWKEYDRLMLSRCQKLIVLKLDGWETSVGVSAEIEIAKEFNIPIEYLEKD